MEKERINRISDSEWQIMEQIWAFCDQEQELGITQPYLMEILGARWNKNTVHTFLKRLCDKGYLQAMKETSPHRYVPIVNRQECEKEERQSFLERVYQGSAGRTVAAFVREGGLKKEELVELRKLLDELE